MPSILQPYFLLALLLALASAFPLQTRDVQWAFSLFPTPQCNGTGDLHVGSGSTGCRANLPSIAAAYQVTSVADDCRIDFFDNTMCEVSSTPETTDVVSSSANAQSCRIPSSKHRYGSYKVTCGEVEHSEI